MINKNTIVLNTKTYYTPSFTGTIGVKILKLFDNDTVLVKTQKNKPFIRDIKYVYNTSESAKKGGRDWEHDDRKRRRKKKG